MEKELRLRKNKIIKFKNIKELYEVEDNYKLLINNLFVDNKLNIYLLYLLVDVVFGQQIIIKDIPLETLINMYKPYRKNIDNKLLEEYNNYDKLLLKIIKEKELDKKITIDTIYLIMSFHNKDIAELFIKDHYEEIKEVLLKIRIEPMPIGTYLSTDYVNYWDTEVMAFNMNGKYLKDIIIINHDIINLGTFNGFYSIFENYFNIFDSRYNEEKTNISYFDYKNYQNLNIRDKIKELFESIIENQDTISIKFAITISSIMSKDEFKKIKNISYNQSNIKEIHQILDILYNSEYITEQIINLKLCLCKLNLNNIDKINNSSIYNTIEIMQYKNNNPNSIKYNKLRKIYLNNLKIKFNIKDEEYDTYINKIFERIITEDDKILYKESILKNKLDIVTYSKSKIILDSKVLENINDKDIYDYNQYIIDNLIEKTRIILKDDYTKQEEQENRKDYLTSLLMIGEDKFIKITQSINKDNIGDIIVLITSINKETNNINNTIEYIEFITKDNIISKEEYKFLYSSYNYYLQLKDKYSQEELLKQLKYINYKYDYLRERINTLKELYINKQLNINSDLYMETKELFIAQIKNNNKLLLDDSYDYIITNLFNRVIKKDNLQYIYNIKDIKELIVYYKTKKNEINTNIFQIKDLINYNQKQHSIINNILNDIEYNQNNATNSLKLLLLFGYDNSIKILNNINIKEINKLLNSINKDNTNFNDYKPYINYILKDNKIYKKENYFLLKYSEIYILIKDTYNEEYIYNILKLIDEKNNITIPNNAYKIKKYLHSIPKDNNINKIILEIITMYTRTQNIYTKTIPNIEGQYNEYTYKTIDMQDEKIFFYPYEINCCMTIDGKAESCLKHAILNPNGRLFGVFKDNKIIALSWVWRNNGILCFDNIEVNKKDINNKELGNILLNIYLKVSEDFIKISSSIEPEDEKIKIITLGRNDYDIKIENINKLTIINNKEIFKPKDNNSLYLTDSQNKQYILYKEDNYSKQKDTSTLYKRKRNKVRTFDDYKNDYELIEHLNHIRFNSGLEELYKCYIYGFIADDFYIAIDNNYKIDIVKYGNDKRKEKEISKLLIILKHRLLKIKKQEEIFKKERKELLNNQNISNEDYLSFIKEEQKSSKITIDNNYYYHGTSLEGIISILNQKAIISNFRNYHRIKRIGLSNGLTHICLSKKNSNLYKRYIENGIGLIIDNNIDIVTNTINKELLNLDNKNYRYINDEEEYQTKNIITIDHIKAVTISLKNKEDISKLIIIYKSMLKFNTILPIIDIERNIIIPEYLLNNIIKENNKKKYQKITTKFLVS